MQHRRESKKMRVLVAVVVVVLVTEEILAAGPGGKGKEYCAPGCKTKINALASRVSVLEQPKEWEMVFRASKGDGGNLVAKWQSSHPYNEDQAATAIDLTKNFYGVYKSSKVEDWNSLVIDQVKVALFDKNGVEKVFMIFDGRRSTKTTFYTYNNLMASSMKNMMETTSYNYFSIVGHDAWSRHFFISRSYGGCGNDQAFFCVVDDGNTVCDWMNQEAKPYFLYCENGGPCNMATEASIADTFAIFIKIKA